jgi:hypothetical protein
MRLARFDGDGLVLEAVTVPDEILAINSGDPDAASAARPAEVGDFFPPSLGFEPVAEDVAAGWRRVGTEMLPPGPLEISLDELKTAKAAAVNIRRDQVIAGGYQHNFGGSAGIRTLDQRTEMDAINWLGLKGIADDAIAAGLGSAPIDIRDAGDQTFQASATVVSGAMVAMGQWRGAIMGHAWALKDAIKAAGDVASLDAIDVDAGWPGA